MSGMEIREVTWADLCPLLELYTHLHQNAVPEECQAISALWQEILTDKNHHILLGFLEGRAVSSCVLVIVPNLTNGQRPYALIENVVTHAAYRGKGYAARVLQRAKELALARGCYKIMLMTGSKQEGVLSFYEKAGYNRQDKTAFIQWLT